MHYEDLIVSFILSVLLIIFLVVVVSSVKSFSSVSARCGTPLEGQVYTFLLDDSGENITFTFNSDQTVTFGSSLSNLNTISSKNISLSDTSFTIQENDIITELFGDYGYFVRNCSGKTLYSSNDYIALSLLSSFNGNDVPIKNNELGIIILNSNFAAGNEIQYNFNNASMRRSKQLVKTFFKR